LGTFVDEAVDRIKDGTITGYIYDPNTALLRRRDEGDEEEPARWAGSV
jgi:hypothetical protein